MRVVRISAEVAQELEEAAAWYEREIPISETVRLDVPESLIQFPGNHRAMAQE